MKKRKSKRNKYTLILILVLGISIGYAALASNLKINGTSKVKSATWDIHWEKVKVKEGSVAADDNHKARITDAARTEVEYSVELTEPGDYYEFTVDAKNDGTIDAEVYSVESKYNDAVINDENKLPSYVSYSVSYEDGTPIEQGNALDHGQKQTYKVKVLYRDDIDSSELPTSNITLDLKFKVEYKQKEKSKHEEPIESKEPGTGVFFDPATRRTCDGTIFSVDRIKNGESSCYKWYIVKDDGENYTLILDHNIGNYVDWSSVSNTKVGPDTSLQEINRVTSTWTRVEPLNYLYDLSGNENAYGKLECTNGVCVNGSGAVLAGSSSNPLRARMIEGDEIAALANEIGSEENEIYHWTRNSNFGDTGDMTGVKFSSISYFKDKNGNGNNDLKWFLDNTQKEAKNEYGSTENSYGEDIDGYWTLSVLNESWDASWFVNPYGDLDCGNRAEKTGVRPVITVKKNLVKIQ